MPPPAPSSSREQPGSNSNLNGILSDLDDDDNQYPNQQFSESQLTILREAASILRVPQRDLPETLATLNSSTVPLFEMNNFFATGSGVDFDTMSVPQADEQSGAFLLGADYDFIGLPHADEQSGAFLLGADYDFIGLPQSSQGDGTAMIGASSDAQSFFPSFDQTQGNELFLSSDTLDLLQQLDNPYLDVQNNAFVPNFAANNPAIPGSGQPHGYNYSSLQGANAEVLEQDRSSGSGSGSGDVSKSPTGRATNSTENASPGSFASTGSLVIITPPSESESALAPAPIRTPPEVAEELTRAALLGPCSHVWVLPPRKPRKNKQSDPENAARKRRTSGKPPHVPKHRGAFKDAKQRETTALTRQLKACIRCRFYKERCNPDPTNPNGACLTCQRVGRAKCKLPCLRYKIMDASLYRDQDTPYPFFTKRFRNMDVVDLTGWASPVIKTIEISQGFGTGYKVEVREFIPVEGDLIHEVWSHNGVRKYYKTPDWAIANMAKMSEIMKKSAKEDIGPYITHLIDPSDALLWNTYWMAYKHSKEASTEEERSLLSHTFQLWMASRKTSFPEKIQDGETLGSDRIVDPTYLQFNTRPLPALMVAQLELITFSVLLKPLSKAVLNELQTMILANKKNYWLTIYLTVFLLLHNCAMMTRRDEEYARQIALETQFANPRSISAFHMGILTMLAHFHLINKGNRPFNLAMNPAGIKELASAAELNGEQVKFVQETAIMVNERAAEISTVREATAFSHDYYFLSQLYDEEWKPTATA